MSNSQDQKIDQWLKEEAAHRNERVPESFHAGFIQILDNLPEHKELPAPKASRTQAVIKKKLLAFASVAILLIIFAVGTVVSPVFADWVHSFFNRPGLDKGLQTAAQQGFSQTSQASVTDQGITVTVKEVLADTKRLIMTYNLQKADGSLLDPTTIFERVDLGPNPSTFYYTKDGNDFYITTDEGKIITQKSAYMLPSGRMAKQSFRRVLPHGDYADLLFDLKEHASAKQLYVNILLKKVNGVEGSWKLKVPVNLEKSIAATKRIPIDATYTTPSGLDIQLNSITLSPTLTTLALQSEWTHERKQELEAKHPEFFHDYSKKWLNQRWVQYDVLDESGKVVMSTALPSSAEGNRILVEDHDDTSTSRPSDGNTSIVSQSYLPLVSQKNLRFVLKGIAQYERLNLDWKIDLRDLDKKNQTFTYKSFQSTLTGIHYGENSSTLELVEETTLMGAGFDVLDESGRILPTPNEGLQGEWETLDPETRKRRLKLQIPVQGLTKETKSITLRFTSIVTYDSYVNWQVPISIAP
ncbi:DUF4179 domain-containing protein [Brevibacillus reuszeri]|uniref:DUF4179 domain-containing protein n=1 Tax=Brevibacillus reuszeri TaxID=54915 RepID=UPI00289F3A3A|nr:DUF4179 domain-containing protein [Brevibacillus reuszeri]